MVGGTADWKSVCSSTTAVPVRLTDLLMHLFRPAGRLTFASRGKSKQKRLPHHPALRCAPGSLASVLLRGSSRRAIHGPSFLARHPCLATLYATPPFGLLKGRLGAQRIFRRAYSPQAVRRQQVCALNGGLSLRSEAALQKTRYCLPARTGSPVRRVSGIGVQGVERQGCRERRKGPGTALVRRPLERRWNERTRNAAKRSAGPYAGGVFSLLTFSLRKQT